MIYKFRYTTFALLCSLSLFSESLKGIAGHPKPFPCGELSLPTAKKCLIWHRVKQAILQAQEQQVKSGHVVWSVPGPEVNHYEEISMNTVLHDLVPLGASDDQIIEFVISFTTLLDEILRLQRTFNDERYGPESVFPANHFRHSRWKPKTCSTIFSQTVKRNPQRLLSNKYLREKIRAL